MEIRRETLRSASIGPADTEASQHWPSTWTIRPFAVGIVMRLAAGPLVTAPGMAAPREWQVGGGALCQPTRTPSASGRFGGILRSGIRSAAGSLPPGIPSPFRLHV